jgi:PAS domain-containing protein
MSKKPTYEELVQRVRELEKADPVCKQPEEALRHHKELLQLFVKHTPAAVAMCDLQMRYLSYSDRWAQDYGLGTENL